MVGHGDDEVHVPLGDPGGPILSFGIVGYLGVGEDRCREECLGPDGLYLMVEILYELGNIAALLLSPEGVVIVVPAQVQGEFSLYKPLGYGALYPDRKQPGVHPPALDECLQGLLI